MTYGWNSSPTRAEVKYSLADAQGTVTGTVYQVGKYQVTVPGPEAEVTFVDRSDVGTDPRATFPNLEVVDGVLTLPVSDLVSVVLSRLSPADLATALLTDDDARQVLLDQLAAPSYRYWIDANVTHDDRERFLAAVRKSVHDRCLADLAEKLAGDEFKVCQDANHWRHVEQINETLRHLDVRGRDGKLVQFGGREKPTGGRGELEIGGRAWEEARAFWRERILAAFPLPVEPATKKCAACKGTGKDDPGEMNPQAATACEVCGGSGKVRP